MFIPIHDANKLERIDRQWVTLALIIINVAIFVGGLIWASKPEEAGLFYVSYGFAPAYIFDGVPASSPFLQVPESLSFLSYGFLHGSWMHLIGNMAFLWVFGDNVEDAMGHWRYLAFYLLCVAAAAFAHGLLFIDDPSPLIGASGAVSGIVAAYLLLHPKIWVWVLVLFRLPIMLPTWVILGGWIAIQIGSAFLNDGSNVSFVSHLGGLAAGAILVAILKSRDVRLFDMQMKPPRAARLADHPVNNAKLPSMLERIGPKAKPQQPK